MQIENAHQVQLVGGDLAQCLKLDADLLAMGKIEEPLLEQWCGTISCDRRRAAKKNLKHNPVPFFVGPLDHDIGCASENYVAEIAWDCLNLRVNRSLRNIAPCATSYRQETIYARDGVELSRALMAQWMGKVGFELQPLADYVLERIRQAERVFADETSLPTLAPGSGQVKKAWLWAYARDDRPYGATSPPMVAYRFEDSRGTACVARHMAGFIGILQVDGYSAYTKLAKASAGANDAVTLAGCWAHLRRRFYEL